MQPAGPTLTRADLSGEALRLGRLLVELLPKPETLGLLALMLLKGVQLDQEAKGNLIREKSKPLRWYRAK